MSGRRGSRAGAVTRRGTRRRCRTRSRSRSCRARSAHSSAVISLVALPADQHDLVADRDRSSPQSTISWSIVTVADDRPAPAADQHLAAVRTGRGARRRRSRSARWRRWPRRRAVAQPVRQPLPAGDALHERHPRLQRQHRAAARPPGGRPPGPGEMPYIAMPRGRSERGRRDGRARRPSWRHARAATGAGELGQHAREPASCAAVYGSVGLVGDGQVGAHAGRAAAAGGRRDARGQRRRSSPAAAPTRCIPVSTLRCTPMARRTPPRRQRVDARRV